MEHISEPPLNLNNFQFWYNSLQINASVFDAGYLVTGNLAQPTDPAALQAHRRKANKVKSLILQGLPESIVNDLPSDVLTSTPHDICNLVRDKVVSNNAFSFEALLARAMSIKFHYGDDLEDYVKKHKRERICMINAGYPLIENELTTVRIMIKGIKGHPTLAPLYMFLAALPAATISDFTDDITHALLEDGAESSTPYL